MKALSTDVVIIGGSLVGLSASVFLSWRGIKNIVIEKHTGSHPHPRAMGYTEHTLEFFRAVGLGEKIPQASPDVRLRRMRIESLAGKWLEEFPWTPGKETIKPGTFSPTTGAGIPQDKLEPILRTRAIELGSNLMLGFEMKNFEQDSNGVKVTIRNRESGEGSTIEAKYMIPADGGDSPIREQLGIKRSGIGHLSTVRSVLFSCDEADTYLDRGIQQFEIEQADFKAFLTTYHDGRWVLMFKDDIERNEEELKKAIKQALGKDMEFKIMTTGKWEMKGLIAENYSSGRVFLAGDSAHQLPPTRGGYGANTGIDDVYNLAWKLELVLLGLSSEELLKTYHDERQPIGLLRHDQTFARPDYIRFTGRKLEHVTLYSESAIELGQLLKSSAVMGVSEVLPPAALPSEWAGQPGVRAPHAWVTCKGKMISTIDLFTRDFVLLSEDKRWKELAMTATERTGIKVRTIIVGEDIHFNTTDDFKTLFGLGNKGAVLVRPDGVVGWKQYENIPLSNNELAKVLSLICSSIKFV